MTVVINECTLEWLLFTPVERYVNNNKKNQNICIAHALDFDRKKWHFDSSDCQCRF